MTDICFVWETYELNKIYEYLVSLYNCDDMCIMNSNWLKNTTRHKKSINLIKKELEIIIKCIK